ncbi:MAG: hypothetical protein Q7S29_01100 [Candidatus Peribacter sp.]|nr:hypothetical protein [Candidatus Peribacter sp.]
MKHPFMTTILVVALGFIGLHLFYYEHARSPEELAEKLVAQKHKAKDCFLFRTFDIGPRPTTYEMQMRCVREYAKLTRDPSACELLMPSEYGLSCINDVTSQEYENHMNSGFFEWDECSKPQSDPLRLDWCDLLRAHRNRNAADFLHIRNDVIRAGCTLKFEAWEKYPHLRGSFYFGKSAPQ